MTRRKGLGPQGSGALSGLPPPRAVVGSAAAVLGVYLAVRPDYGRDSANLAAHAAGLPLSSASVPVPLAFVPGSLVEQAAAYIQEATGVALAALVKGLPTGDQADRVELAGDPLGLGVVPSTGGASFSFSSSVFGQAVNVSKQDAPTVGKSQGDGKPAEESDSWFEDVFVDPNSPQFVAAASKYEIAEVDPESSGYFVPPLLGGGGGGALGAGGAGAGAGAGATLTGAVIDGYVSGATVFLDLNGDYQWQSDEPYAVTDEQGAYSFSTSVSVDGYNIVSLGGVDQQTGADIDTLIAPADIPYVTPLSTVYAYADASGTGADLLSNLGGLSTDDLMYDPLALAQAGGGGADQATTVLRTGAALLTVASAAAATFEGAGGSADGAVRNIFATMSSLGGEVLNDIVNDTSGGSAATSAFESIVYGALETATGKSKTELVASYGGLVSNSAAAVETVTSALKTITKDQITTLNALAAVGQKDVFNAVKDVATRIKNGEIGGNDASIASTVGAINKDTLNNLVATQKALNAASSGPLSAKSDSVTVDAPLGLEDSVKQFDILANDKYVNGGSLNLLAAGVYDPLALAGTGAWDSESGVFKFQLSASDLAEKDTLAADIGATGDFLVNFVSGRTLTLVGADGVVKTIESFSVTQAAIPESEDVEVSVTIGAAGDELTAGDYRFLTSKTLPEGYELDIVKRGDGNQNPRDLLEIRVMGQGHYGDSDPGDSVPTAFQLVYVVQSDTAPEVSTTGVVQVNIRPTAPSVELADVVVREAAQAGEAQEGIGGILLEEDGVSYTAIPFPVQVKVAGGTADSGLGYNGSLVFYGAASSSVHTQAIRDAGLTGDAKIKLVTHYAGNYAVKQIEVSGGDNYFKIAEVEWDPVGGVWVATGEEVNLPGTVEEIQALLAGLDAESDTFNGDSVYSLGQDQLGSIDAVSAVFVNDKAFAVSTGKKPADISGSQIADESFTDTDSSALGVYDLAKDAAGKHPAGTFALRTIKAVAPSDEFALGNTYKGMPVYSLSADAAGNHPAGDYVFLWNDTLQGYDLLRVDYDEALYKWKAIDDSLVIKSILAGDPVGKVSGGDYDGKSVYSVDAEAFLAHEVPSGEYVVVGSSLVPVTAAPAVGEETETTTYTTGDEAAIAIGRLIQSTDEGDLDGLAGSYSSPTQLYEAGDSSQSPVFALAANEVGEHAAGTYIFVENEASDGFDIVKVTWDGAAWALALDGEGNSQQFDSSVDDRYELVPVEQVDGSSTWTNTGYWVWAVEGADFRPAILTGDFSKLQLLLPESFSGDIQGFHVVAETRYGPFSNSTRSDAASIEVSPTTDGLDLNLGDVSAGLVEALVSDLDEDSEGALFPADTLDSLAIDSTSVALHDDDGSEGLAARLSIGAGLTAAQASLIVSDSAGAAWSWRYVAGSEKQSVELFVSEDAVDQHETLKQALGAIQLKVGANHSGDVGVQLELGAFEYGGQLTDGQPVAGNLRFDPQVMEGAVVVNPVTDTPLMPSLDLVLYQAEQDAGGVWDQAQHQVEAGGPYAVDVSYVVDGPDADEFFYVAVKTSGANSLESVAAELGFAVSGYVADTSQAGWAIIDLEAVGGQPFSVVLGADTFSAFDIEMAPVARDGDGETPSTPYAFGKSQLLHFPFVSQPQEASFSFRPVKWAEDGALSLADLITLAPGPGRQEGDLQIQIKALDGTQLTVYKGGKTYDSGTELLVDLADLVASDLADPDASLLSGFTLTGPKNFYGSVSLSVEVLDPYRDDSTQAPETSGVQDKKVTIDAVPDGVNQTALESLAASPLQMSLGVEYNLLDVDEGNLAAAIKQLDADEGYTVRLVLPAGADAASAVVKVDGQFVVPTVTPDALRDKVNGLGIEDVYAVPEANRFGVEAGDYQIVGSREDGYSLTAVINGVLDSESTISDLNPFAVEAFLGMGRVSYTFSKEDIESASSSIYIKPGAGLAALDSLAFLVFTNQAGAVQTIPNEVVVGLEVSADALAPEAQIADATGEEDDPLGIALNIDLPINESRVGFEKLGLWIETTNAGLEGATFTAGPEGGASVSYSYDSINSRWEIFSSTVQFDPASIKFFPPDHFSGEVELTITPFAQTGSDVEGREFAEPMTSSVRVTATTEAFTLDPTHTFSTKEDVFAPLDLAGLVSFDGDVSSESDEVLVFTVTTPQEIRLYKGSVMVSPTNSGVETFTYVFSVRVADLASAGYTSPYKLIGSPDYSTPEEGVEVTINARALEPASGVQSAGQDLTGTVVIQPVPDAPVAPLRVATTLMIKEYQGAASATSVVQLDKVLNLPATSTGKLDEVVNLLIQVNDAFVIEKDGVEAGKDAEGAWYVIAASGYGDYTLRGTDYGSTSGSINLNAKTQTVIDHGSGDWTGLDPSEGSTASVQKTIQLTVSPVASGIKSENDATLKPVTVNEDEYNGSLAGGVPKAIALNQFIDVAAVATDTSGESVLYYFKLPAAGVTLKSLSGAALPAPFQDGGSMVYAVDAEADGSGLADFGLVTDRNFSGELTIEVATASYEPTTGERSARGEFQGVTLTVSPVADKPLLSTPAEASGLVTAEAVGVKLPIRAYLQDTDGSETLDVEVSITGGSEGDLTLVSAPGDVLATSVGGVLTYTVNRSSDVDLGDLMLVTANDYRGNTSLVATITATTTDGAVVLDPPVSKTFDVSVFQELKPLEFTLAIKTATRDTTVFDLDGSEFSGTVYAGGTYVLFKDDGTGEFKLQPVSQIGSTTMYEPTGDPITVDSGDASSAERFWDGTNDASSVGSYAGLSEGRLLFDFVQESVDGLPSGVTPENLSILIQVAGGDIGMPTNAYFQAKSAGSSVFQPIGASLEGGQIWLLSGSDLFEPSVDGTFSWSNALKEISYVNGDGDDKDVVFKPTAFLSDPVGGSTSSYAYAATDGVALTLEGDPAMGYSDPLVLSINGDPIESGPATEVAIDLDGITGTTESALSWFTDGQANYAFLVQSEKVVLNTPFSVLDAFVDFDALKTAVGTAALADDVIDLAELTYAGVGFWIDGNADGVYDAGEMKDDFTGIEISLPETLARSSSAGQIQSLYEAPVVVNGDGTGALFAVAIPYAVTPSPTPGVGLVSDGPGVSVDFVGASQGGAVLIPEDVASKPGFVVSLTEAVPNAGATVNHLIKVTLSSNGTPLGSGIELSAGASALDDQGKTYFILTEADVGKTVKVLGLADHWTGDIEVTATAFASAIQGTQVVTYEGGTASSSLKVEGVPDEPVLEMIASSADRPQEGSTIFLTDDWLSGGNSLVEIDSPDASETLSLSFVVTPLSGLSESDYVVKYNGNLADKNTDGQYVIDSPSLAGVSINLNPGVAGVIEVSVEGYSTQNGMQAYAAGVATYTIDIESVADGVKDTFGSGLVTSVAASEGAEQVLLPGLEVAIKDSTELVEVGLLIGGSSQAVENLLSVQGWVNQELTSDVLGEFVGGGLTYGGTVGDGEWMYLTRQATAPGDYTLATTPLTFSNYFDGTVEYMLRASTTELVEGKRSEAYAYSGTGTINISPSVESSEFDLVIQTTKHLSGASETYQVSDTVFVEETLSSGNEYVSYFKIEATPFDTIGDDGGEEVVVSVAASVAGGYGDYFTVTPVDGPADVYAVSYVSGSGDPTPEGLTLALSYTITEGDATPVTKTLERTIAIELEKDVSEATLDDFVDDSNLPLPVSFSVTDGDDAALEIEVPLVPVGDQASSDDDIFYILSGVPAWLTPVDDAGGPVGELLDTAAGLSQFRFALDEVAGGTISFAVAYDAITANSTDGGSIGWTTVFVEPTNFRTSTAAQQFTFSVERVPAPQPPQIFGPSVFSQQENETIVVGDLSLSAGEFHLDTVSGDLYLSEDLSLIDADVLREDGEDVLVLYRHIDGKVDTSAAGRTEIVLSDLSPAQIQWFEDYTPLTADLADLAATRFHTFLPVTLEADQLTGVEAGKYVANVLSKYSLADVTNGTLAALDITPKDENQVEPSYFELVAIQTLGDQTAEAVRQFKVTYQNIPEDVSIVGIPTALVDIEEESFAPLYGVTVADWDPESGDQLSLEVRIPESVTLRQLSTADLTSSEPIVPSYVEDGFAVYSLDAESLRGLQVFGAGGALFVKGDNGWIPVEENSDGVIARLASPVVPFDSETLDESPIEVDGEFSPVIGLLAPGGTGGVEGYSVTVTAQASDPSTGVLGQKAETSFDLNVIPTLDEPSLSLSTGLFLDAQVAPDGGEPFWDLGPGERLSKSVRMLEEKTGKFSFTAFSPDPMEQAVTTVVLSDEAVAEFDIAFEGLAGGAQLVEVSETTFEITAKQSSAITVLLTPKDPNYSNLLSGQKLDINASADDSDTVSVSALPYLTIQTESQFEAVALRSVEHPGSAVSDVIYVPIVVSDMNDQPDIADEGDFAHDFTELDGVTLDETVNEFEGTLTFTDDDGVYVKDGVPEHAISFTRLDGSAEGARGTFSVDAYTPTESGPQTITWTYTVADSALDDLALGQQATEVYEILVDDGKLLGQDRQNITITFTGANDLPIFVKDAETGSLTNIVIAGDAGRVESEVMVSFTDADLRQSSGSYRLVADQSADVSIAFVNFSSDAMLATNRIKTDVLDGDFVAPLSVDKASGGVDGAIRLSVDALNQVVDFWVEGESVSLNYTIAIGENIGLDDGSTFQTTVEEDIELVINQFILPDFGKLFAGNAVYSEYLFGVGGQSNDFSRFDSGVVANDLTLLHQDYIFATSTAEVFGKPPGGYVSEAGGLSVVPGEVVIDSDQWLQEGPMTISLSVDADSTTTTDDYVFDGGWYDRVGVQASQAADPSIVMRVGDTLTVKDVPFNHPLYFVTGFNADGSFDPAQVVSVDAGGGSALVSHQFSEAGTYYYVCSYHPNMQGTITVVSEEVAADLGGAMTSNSDYTLWAPSAGDEFAGGAFVIPADLSAGGVSFDAPAIISSAEKNSNIHGTAGRDIIYLSEGSTGGLLYGADGIDVVHGGSGSDMLVASQGVDLLTGGGGRDAFVVSSGLVFDLVGDETQEILEAFLPDTGVDMAKALSATQSLGEVGLAAVISDFDGSIDALVFDGFASDVFVSNISSDLAFVYVEALAESAYEYVGVMLLLSDVSPFEVTDSNTFIYA